MDRENLYRGKIKGSNTGYQELDWAFGNFVKELETGRCFIVDLGHFDGNTKLQDVMIEVVPETVCQYTGLTDKNGRKIFKGDIVKGIAYSHNFVGYIVWIDKIAGFGVRYFNRHREPTAWENSSILKMMQLGRKDEFAAEVIGNMQDNPSLLEGGEP